MSEEAEVYQIKSKVEFLNVEPDPEVKKLVDGLNDEGRLDLLKFCLTWGVIRQVMELTSEPPTMDGVNRALCKVREAIVAE